MTQRLREHAGLLAASGRTVTAAARECGLSWPVVHQAFAAAVDPVLAAVPAPARWLGIDERQRGRPQWRADEQTGE